MDDCAFITPTLQQSVIGAAAVPVVQPAKELTMPYNDPDPTDPNMLVGVELPGTAESTRDMAYVFAEEFARMGFSRKKLLRVFQTPFYAGAHRAYLELGGAEIEKIVDECLELWGRIELGERETKPPN